MADTVTKAQRPIWLAEDEKVVQIIDQRLLPHEFRVVDLTTVDHVIHAIVDMMVRGAPLIGATGAFGAYLAAVNAGETNFEADFRRECERLKTHG